MELAACWNVNHRYLISPICSNIRNNIKFNKLPFFHFSTYPFQFHYFNNNTKSCSLTLLTHAKKKKSNFESSPVVKPIIIEQVSEKDDVGIEEQEEELVVVDEFNDEEFLDDEDYFEEEYLTEDVEVYSGDGAEGGGILLAGTWWDKEALAIAENVTEAFDDIGMYAFRTLANATIQVRIEKLSTKSGSPSMSDIEAFTVAYRTRLDEAEIAKTIPENVSLEVSSPGVERVIRIPQDFDRFKERPMYVKYVAEVASTGLSSENDGVFRLLSFNLETNSCTWGLADVRINREKAGKGRPMNKKQREWRLTTPFDSVRLVRIYSEI